MRYVVWCNSGRTIVAVMLLGFPLVVSGEAGAVSLADLIASNGSIIVGDKLFNHFTGTTSFDAGIVPAGCCQISSPAQSMLQGQRLAEILDLRSPVWRRPAVFS